MIDVDMAQPSPRIRTKTNLLPPKVDEEYFEIIDQLRLGRIDVEQYHKACLNYFHPKVLGGDFRKHEEIALAQNDELELLRRHVDERRYTVLLYKVDKNAVHPPHHHFNVVSTQIVVRGAIRLREFDRLDRDANGRLRMALVSDRTLERGDWFQASEWKRNVHWFQAIEEEALVFNTNARGFEDKTFDLDDASFGRRYIDPTQMNSDGSVLGRAIDKEEANRLFANQSLDSFAFPAIKSRTRGGENGA